MREERGQRPLIGITPGQVIAGGEEVQLVAVIAVAAREPDQQENDESRQPEQRTEREPRDPWSEIEA